MAAGCGGKVVGQEFDGSGSVIDSGSQYWKGRVRTLVEKSCSIFYVEVTGGAVLIRKTVVEETQFQSTFRSRILSLQSARSSWRNYPSAIPNSFPTATVLFLEFRPGNESWIRVFAAKIIGEKIRKNIRRQLQAPQYQGRAELGTCIYKNIGIIFRKLINY